MQQTLELLYEILSEQTDPMLFETPELDQQFQEVEQFFSGDKKRQILASDILRLSEKSLCGGLPGGS